MPSPEEIPSWINEQIRDSLEALRKMHERLEAEAPQIEHAISQLDMDISVALREDDSDNPMMRRSAYCTTLWAQNGWFPSSWYTPLALLNQTAAVLGSDDHDVAEAAIARHFESEIPRILKDLSSRHPKREPILADAFAAHAAERYTVSIPVMLLQADGIGAEFFGIDSIYTLSPPNFAKIKAKCESGDNILRIRHLYFLVATLTPINASRAKRARYPGQMSRHAVIHGEATDYASRLNALKSVSWLQFVSELVSF